MKVNEKLLREFMIGAASKMDIGEEAAKTLADNLISANLWGINSHGIGRFPNYMRRLRLNLINRKPNIGVTIKRPATICVDGDNGLGSVVTKYATEKLIELAKTYGVAMGEIKNSNHFGAAGYYCNLAAEQGFGMLISTVAPPNMPPFGSAEAYFGTNPFAIGMPRKERPHIIVDIATSVAAKGKIRECARKGLPIPEGWAIDVDGNPTTDAQKAIDGLVLPMAGHKGSGIALAIEYLAGVLSGSAYGRDVVMQYGDDPTPANVGHSIIVFDPIAFMDEETYEARLENFCEELRGLKLAKGFEKILLPGEVELLKENRTLEDGIEMDEKLYKDFCDVAAYTGVPVTF